MIDDLRHYRVEIVCKKGVPVGVPPHLPNPPIFKNGPEFKNWFLTKRLLFILTPYSTNINISQ